MKYNRLMNKIYKAYNDFRENNNCYPKGVLLSKKTYETIKKETGVKTITTICGVPVNEYLYGYKSCSDFYFYKN